MQYENKNNSFHNKSWQMKKNANKTNKIKQNKQQFEIKIIETGKINEYDLAQEVSIQNKIILDMVGVNSSFLFLIIGR